MHSMIGSLASADVERAHSGSSFEDFFRAEYPDLARALFLLTRDPVEAEELAQEALARTYERWDRVRGMESPVGYVYRTAMNLNRKRIRRLAVRARRLVPGGSEPDPLLAAEARSDILRALGTIPRTQREALILVEWVGLDAEEAGRILGIEASSVRGRLFRARATIRDRFGGDDE
jgi:RNA polymerase sigma-70 factor (ECF subfamily)